MTSIRGFLRGLFGKRPKFSWFKPTGALAADLDAVVREANEHGHDGLALAGLDLAGRLGALAHMTTLRALELRDARLTDEDLAALAGRAELLHLDLSGAPVSGACLVHAGGLPQLEHLDLSRTRLVDVAVLALRSYPALATLDVSGTRLTAGALAHLRLLPALKQVRLGGLGLEQAAKDAFASRPEVTVECEAPVAV